MRALRVGERPGVGQGLRGIGLLMLCMVLGACEELDPVYTVDLCGGDRVISKNCRQCAQPPYAERCPQCQGPDADPNCSPQAVTGSNAGTSAGDPAPNSGGTSSVGGAMSLPKGGNAAPTGGTAGSAVALDACNNTCQLPTRACWAKEATCVECVLPSDCSGSTCDSNSHRCVECTSASDCSSGACDATLQKCVDCMSDDQCQRNPVDNVCNILHKCVDCDASHGCTDAAKPACVNEACVACDNDTHCRDQRNKKCFRQTYTCVECLTNANCAAPTPACDTQAHRCVACLGDADCASKHCLEQSALCVECEADADCGDAAKAHCGSNNSCGKCTTNAQCQHLTDTPACDAASGSCVACVDDSTCGDNACIRAQHICSTVKRGSVTACGACEADTECATTLKCAALTFGAAALPKKYCLYNRAAVVSCATTATSAIRPYSRTLQVTSVDGATGPYCAPQTTCEATLAATNPVGGSNCQASTDCGVPDVEDGICNDAKRCTYTCTTDVDCPKEGLRACNSARLCSQAAM
jgi:hypothetical protein